MFRSILLGLVATTALALPAFAQTIEIDDAYARSSNPVAGAAFMIIHNTGEEADRLLSVRSEAAQRVELHTHIEEDGLMRMIHVEEGFILPAGAALHLKRGGDHVMFMGLAAPFEQGQTVTLTLVFENAGEVTVDVPVDLDRQDMPGHGTQDH